MTSVTKYIIVLILGLCYLNSLGNSKVLIKANILRGERFVTAKTNAKEMENKVSEVLKKKGFDIVTTIQPTGDMLLVDLFVYQFPAQFPAVTITIRTQNGIHYIDQECKKIYGGELTSFQMATELAERVPVELNKDLVYRASMEYLISTNRTGNAARYAGNSNYYATLKWTDDNKVPFIIPNDLQLYLFYASNFTGLRKQLARGPIILKLRINNAGRFELVDTNWQVDLYEEQKIGIQEFIDSFPLWLTNAEVENIEIVYGLK